MYSFLKFFLILILLFSCKKEKLDPGSIKKVLLVKVDYLTNEFNSGKEFSYFKEVNDSDSIQAFVKYLEPNPTGRLTVFYGVNKDTIFDGTELIENKGEILYPNNMDNNLFYHKHELPITQPEETRFQILHKNPTIPIIYDSIWKEVGRLKIVEAYRKSNPNAKIGLFLHQPRLSSPINGSWKWYLIFKD